MTIRKILVEPDKFLRQKSKPVDIVDKDLQTLMDDMLETMYNAPGIGLAAIQVGVPKRVIVIDLSRDGEEKSPMYFVNPEIVSSSNNDATYEEGCLSVPGQFAEIDRPDKCHLKFLDYNGNKKELKAEGLLATCIQHEIDHLEGILFIDYLSKLKKTMIIKKLSKQKKSIERIVV
ncbi:MAG: peptide deformylase [Candidatus Pelagibacter sp.]|nr:peptide deformylase [Candidatus Pelagibacter sp.]OUW78958.1 MAG: peptide deformylase [bacterium TMED217]|tara:strand:+ start:2682 stop:3206 length:525 start_codon:yes stop_codon:yes gene_type:complete